MSPHEARLALCLTKLERLNYYSIVMATTSTSTSRASRPKSERSERRAGADGASSHRCEPEVRRRLVPLEIAARLAETFGLLGDPTRVRIVHALSLSELCTSDLAEAVGMSESAVSHQLRLLRHLQVVRTRRDGKMVYYRLHDDHIRSLFQQGLDHVLEPQEATEGTV